MDIINANNVIQTRFALRLTARNTSSLVWKENVAESVKETQELTTVVKDMTAMSMPPAEVSRPLMCVTANMVSGVTVVCVWMSMSAGGMVGEMAIIVLETLVVLTLQVPITVNALTAGKVRFP